MEINYVKFNLPNIEMSIVRNEDDLEENILGFQHSIRSICQHVLSSYGVLYKFISMTLSVMHVRVKNIKCNTMLMFLGFRLTSQAFSYSFIY